MPTDIPDLELWNRFLDICQRERLPQRARRWYVLRVERFLKAHPEREVRDLGAADVEGYLQAAGRGAEVPGWMFRQLVHELQLFWCYVIGADWALEFRWDYWLSSAVELESDHPTVARQNHPIVVGNPSDAASFVAAFPDLENALVAKIRLKNYSIRTEQHASTGSAVFWCSMVVAIHGSWMGVPSPLI